MFAPRFTVIASAILSLAATSAVGETTPTAICNDNRVPAGSLASGVLNVRLEARSAIWYPNEAGKTSLVVSAFAEEGRKPQIPGPLLRVPAGVEISATIRNSLDHTIYVHGLASRQDTN